MADRCIKHNIAEAEDTSAFESFGHGSICRYAIEDSRTVNNLLTNPTTSEEYRERKAQEQLDAEFQTFVASNPTQEEASTFLADLIKKLKKV